MQTTLGQRTPGTKRWLRWATVAACFGLVAIVAGAVFYAMNVATYDAWGGLLLTILMVLVSLPVLRAIARSENDRLIFWILVAGLFAKIFGALARHTFAFEISQGIADASRYHNQGSMIASLLREGQFQSALQTAYSTGGPREIFALVNTDFIGFFTGLIYFVVGTTKVGGFMVYSWLAFWGAVLFYLAFRIAVPKGRLRLYAGLVMFLPSLVFWPSSIGKEALMMLGLGTFSLGIALLMKQRWQIALVPLTAGALFAGTVRPHVGVFCCAAGVFAYLIRPATHRSGVSKAIKAAILVACLGSFVFVLFNIGPILKTVGIDPNEDLVEQITTTAERTQIGGSSFQPVVVTSPARFPVAAFTVLFRPSIFDAGDALTGLAALEGTLLLALAILNARRIFYWVLHMRRIPYVAFVIPYMVLFIIAYSAFANFGLLARQRTQVLPMLVVLFALPAKGSDDGQRARTQDG